MAEQTMGSADAIEMLEAIIMTMRENDIPDPRSLPSTETH
jgi:hypothetical protein